MSSVSSTFLQNQVEKAVDRQQAGQEEIEERLRGLADINEELAFDFVESALQDGDASADSLTEALESLEVWSYNKLSK